MKVVITGATGFVGQEVFKQCLASPAITSIIILSRRQLTEPIAAAAAAESAKVKVLLVEDFLSYSPAVLSEIGGAGACIWALGIIPTNDSKELERVKRVSIEYTMAGVRAFLQQSRSPADNKPKFRFVYVSGGAAERDQDKSLWLMGPYRKIRGQVENKLLEHARDHQNSLEVCILRPGMVLKTEFNVGDLGKSLMPSVQVVALAKVLVDVTLKGLPAGEETLDNTAILRRSNR